MLAKRFFRPKTFMKVKGIPFDQVKIVLRSRTVSKNSRGSVPKDDKIGKSLTVIYLKIELKTKRLFFAFITETDESGCETTTLNTN